MQSDAIAYNPPYQLGTNLELRADSIYLVRLPLKQQFVRLERGTRVVIAETAEHPADSIDSHWVKLAASEKEQGWLRECEMKEVFVPTDSVSQAIHLFSHTHAPWFVGIFTLFIIVWLFRICRRKQLKWAWFGQVDSIYPLLLCLLMSVCATLYESMQIFVPTVWEQFYYAPTLSPFEASLLPALFLTGLWAFVVVLLATLDVVFRRLTPPAALFYLLGLAALCIFCYFFFILTTPYCLGYTALLSLTVYFFKRLYTSLRTPHYRCGRCNHRLKAKGICPHCGAVNR